jgi:uncharacterized protein YdaU (DUF1376 family)
MPLYIADYLADTTHLSAMESGAYLHLIMNYWQNGGLPNDDRQLSRIAKLTDREWRKLKPTLQSFFGPKWRHKRIDQEILEAVRIADSNSGKAREAAKKRWSKHRNGMLGACLEQCSSNARGHAPECTLHTPQEEPIQESKSIDSEEGIWQ